MTMGKRQYTAVHLSDYAGRKICVICPNCGMKRQYDADAMLKRIEDLPMPSLLPKLARAEGCEKVDNTYSDRCQLRYDLSAETR